MHEHVENTLKAPKPVPFGIDGKLFYVTELSRGKDYELRWYDARQVMRFLNFNNLGDLFKYIEHQGYFEEEQKTKFVG